MASNNVQNNRDDIDAKLKKVKEKAESGSKIFNKRYLMDMVDDVTREESSILHLSYSEIQEILEDSLLSNLAKMKKKEVALPKEIEGFRQHIYVPTYHRFL